MLLFVAWVTFQLDKLSNLVLVWGFDIGLV